MWVGANAWFRQSMKTAIVTGVTGQDGQFLATLLLSKGYRVVGLVSADRILQSADWNKSFSKIELLAVDFNDSNSLEDVILGICPDEFYNLAAASSVKYSFDHPFETAKITALMPVRILEILRNNQ